MGDPKRVDGSGLDLDDKLADPLIKGPVDRRYNVNWADHTETDREYLWNETRKWFRKEKAG